MRKFLGTLVVAALSLTMAACTREEGRADSSGASSEAATTPAPASAAPSGPASATPTVDAEDAPPTDAPDFILDSQQNPEFPAPSAPGQDLYATDVRVAAHEDHDRVVIELAGSGTPAWKVEYVEEATVPEGDEVIDVGGEHTLRITMQSISSPENYGQPDLAGQLPVGDARLVSDVFTTGSFETVKTTYVGLEDQVPFRAYTLTDPTRLVVDLATE